MLSSVLRGAGRQWFGAGCNLVGWWGVGVPLAYYLALHTDLGVAGLWGGFATASALQAVVQWAVVMRLDWEGEVQRAAEMLRASEAAEAAASGSVATVDVLATEVAGGGSSGKAAAQSGRKAAKGKAAAKGRGASGTETDDDDNGPGAAPALLSGGGGGLVEQHGHGVPAIMARAFSERTYTTAAAGMSGPLALMGRRRAASAGRLAARLL